MDKKDTLILSPFSKYCGMCKTEKPLDEFNKHAQKPDGRYELCRDCQKICSKKYSTSQKGIDTLRRGHLRRSYGITDKEYNAILQDQGGKCKICGVDSNPDNRAGYFTVDHSHDTGAVRGLLCTKCNALLGLANDKEDILQKAIEYLQNSVEINPSAVNITLQK